MNPFILVSLIFALFCVLERLFPHYSLEEKSQWYTRATFFNLLQLAISYVMSLTWDKYMSGFDSIFHPDPNYPFWNGFMGYIVITWVYYWWHYIRHESDVFWLATHQLHHSIERIEVLASFYKHPLEILSNAVIIGFFTYPILGLDANGAAWLSFWTGIAEVFYHMNIGTPSWIGYIVQRPENHCLHHLKDQRGSHNYADIPIWDMLGGTFKNVTSHVKSGFSNDGELKVKEMIKFKDVLRGKEFPKIFTLDNLFFTILLCVGCMSTVGYIFQSDALRGVGFLTASSPLPFVFSEYNGFETFSTTYHFDGITESNERFGLDMDHLFYGNLQGPYNRKNVFGVALSYGPFFTDDTLVQIRDEILHWSMCQGGLTDELLIPYGVHGIRNGTITIKSKTQGNENLTWSLKIDCRL